MNSVIKSRWSQGQELLANQPRLVWISISFISGIILANLVRLPLWGWLSLAGLILVFILIPRFSRTPIPPRLSIKISPYLLSLSVIVVLGAARVQAAIPNITPGHIAYYLDRQPDVLVTGVVIQTPDLRDTHTNLRLQVESVDLGYGDVNVKGQLLTSVYSDQTYSYGQRLRLRGPLTSPPEFEDFSYRDYLARQNVYAFMSFPEVSFLPGAGGNPITGALEALKQSALKNTHRLFPDPEGSLLAGIVLGVDTGLSENLQEAFRNTGTAHIIAISGFNISIIAGLFIILFRSALGPRLGTLAAILGIVLYTLLVGAGASVVRAAIMGSLALFARQIGRRTMGLNVLTFTAMIMSALNPHVLLDVGFQLSFFATLGLILYIEPFSSFTIRLLSRFGVQGATSDKIIQPITEIVLITYAAQLTSLPLMAYHFGQISPVSLISNPFILPFQPVVMILGGLAVALSLVVFPLGQITAWIALPFVSFTIRVVELFDRIPHGTIRLGNFSVWFVVIYYAVLLGITFGWSSIRTWFSSNTERLRAISLTAGLGLLFLCTSVVWRDTISEGDGRLHITFFDVGSADAILVQTPAGRSVLINGGPSTTRLSESLGRRLPLLHSRLDWLIVGSTGQEEVAALPRLLERYPTEHVLWSGNTQASPASRQLADWLAENSVPVVFAENGQQLDLGKEAFIEVLDEGPRGGVLMIAWKDFQLVLPTGVDADTMSRLGNGDHLDPAEVLLLADAGFAPSNPSEWIENINPQLVVLTVSASDPDGRPDEATLEYLSGRSLLRTDLNGWISISTDGERMWVEAEREAPETVLELTPDIGTPGRQSLPNQLIKMPGIE
jgi:competence protein ComEC